MPIIIGSHSEDFMLLKMKEMSYTRIHSLDYCAGRNEDGLYVWLFTVFLSICVRPHKFLDMFLLLNGQYSYCIDKFMNRLRKYPRQTSLVSYCEMSIFIRYYAFALLELPQSCHLLYRVVYLSISSVHHILR